MTENKAYLSLESASEKNEEIATKIETTDKILQ